MVAVAARVASARPSGKLGGVDVAFYLALAGLGAAISIIGTGRWARLKLAYTSGSVVGGSSGHVQ